MSHMNLLQRLALPGSVMTLSLLTIRVLPNVSVHSRVYSVVSDPQEGGSAKVSEGNLTVWYTSTPSCKMAGKGAGIDSGSGSLKVAVSQIGCNLTVYSAMTKG